MKPIPVKSIKMKIKHDLSSNIPEVRSAGYSLQTLLDAYQHYKSAYETCCRELAEAKNEIRSLNTRLNHAFRDDQLMKDLRAESKDLKEQNRCKDRLLQDKDQLLENKDQLIRELRSQLEVSKQESLQKDQELCCAYLQLERISKGNSETTNFPSSFDVCQKSKSTWKEDSKKEKGSKQDKNEEQSAPEESPEDIVRTPVSSRKSTGRKRGGQQGHEVHKKQLQPDPDKTIIRKVTKAPSGAEKRTDENGKTYYAVQETDLKISTVVTEIRYYVCQEGERPDPEEMDQYRISSYTYSSQLKAFVIFLSIYGSIPVHRLCTILRTLSYNAIDLSAGTVCKWADRLAKNASVMNEEMIHRMMTSEVLHADETGIKISGKLHWAHVLASDDEVAYVITEKRGDKETGPVGILDSSGYSGVVIHDHFKSYQSLEDVRHGECNVHIERYMAGGVRFDHCEACEQMLDLYSRLRKRKEEMLEAGALGLPAEELVQIFEEFKAICTRGMECWEKQLASSENPENLKRYTPPYYTTFRRMLANPEHYLLFVEDFRVPFGNNRAERCVGALKSRIKISRQCVTLKGAQTLMDLMTLTESARSRGDNVLEIYHELLS